MKIIIYKEQGNQEKEIARIPFAIKQPKELLLKAEEIVNYAISQNGDILGIGALSKVASCCLTTCFEDGSVYDTMVVPQNCMSVYYHNSGEVKNGAECKRPKVPVKRRGLLRPADTWWVISPGG